MQKDEIVNRWLKGKEFIRSKDLRPQFRSDTHEYYECPCGGVDHAAIRPLIREGLSEYPGQVMTCFETRRQWVVTATNVAEVIQNEEERYLALLARARPIVEKAIRDRGLSASTIQYLHATHGIDRDTAEQIIDDLRPLTQATAST